MIIIFVRLQFEKTATATKNTERFVMRIHLNLYKIFSVFLSSSSSRSVGMSCLWREYSCMPFSWHYFVVVDAVVISLTVCTWYALEIQRNFKRSHGIFHISFFFRFSFSFTLFNKCALLWIHGEINVKTSNLNARGASDIEKLGFRVWNVAWMSFQWTTSEPQTIRTREKKTHWYFRMNESEVHRNDCHSTGTFYIQH